MNMNYQVHFSRQEGSVAERSIQTTVTIGASTGAVFRALTEPEALEHWLATKVESDPKTGGRFRYEFEFDDPAQNNVQEGEYLEVEDPTRVVLPWMFGFSPKQTTVEYALRAENGSTRVDFTHAGFEEGDPWDGVYERFTGGWQMFLGGLKSYVETGAPSLPMGMRSRRK
jgi:uncharacterized protein YndB with AHSA1/START domain